MCVWGQKHRKLARRSLIPPLFGEGKALVDESKLHDAAIGGPNERAGVGVCYPAEVTYHNA
jgi:hypothetical protein